MKDEINPYIKEGFHDKGMTHGYAMFEDIQIYQIVSMFKVNTTLSHLHKMSDLYYDFSTVMKYYNYLLLDFAY